jgi:NMD protein affecting ribosome stability and mRNA decay
MIAPSSDTCRGCGQPYSRGDSRSIENLCPSCKGTDTFSGMLLTGSDQSMCDFCGYVHPPGVAREKHVCPLPDTGEQDLLPGLPWTQSSRRAA